MFDDDDEFEDQPIDYIDRIEFGGFFMVEPKFSPEEKIFFDDFLSSGEILGKKLFSIKPSVFKNSSVEYIPTFDILSLITSSKPKTENFDDAIEWLNILIDFFFKENSFIKQAYPEIFDFIKPHTINGEIIGFYEEKECTFKINVSNNEVFLSDMKDIDPMGNILWEKDKIQECRYKDLDFGPAYDHILKAMDKNTIEGLVSKNKIKNKSKIL